MPLALLAFIGSLRYLNGQSFCRENTEAVVSRASREIQHVFADDLTVLEFFSGSLMKTRLFLIRHFIFILCFAIAFPFDAFTSTNAATISVEPMTIAAKQRRRAPSKGGKAKASTPKGRTSRSRRGKTSSPSAAAPRTSFDRVMSDNRALLNEANDAEAASTKIEENTLRAHIKFLSDDLLE